jgi:hypothetical protein
VIPKLGLQQQNNAKWKEEQKKEKANTNLCCLRCLWWIYDIEICTSCERKCVLFYGMKQRIGDVKQKVLQDNGVV